MSLNITHTQRCLNCKNFAKRNKIVHTHVVSHILMQLEDGAAAGWQRSKLHPKCCLHVCVCWQRDYAMLRNMKTSKVISSAGVALAIAVEDDKQKISEGCRVFRVEIEQCKLWFCRVLVERGNFVPPAQVSWGFDVAALAGDECEFDFHFEHV